MNSPRKNKLDPFKARILAWIAEGKEQKEILPLLKEDGCSCSASSLSDYLARERASRAEEVFLAQITSGAQQMKKFDAAFKENPAPALKQIMARVNVLVAMLSTQAAVEPAVFDQLNLLLKHVLEWEKVQIKGRDSVLGEKKFQRETCELFLKWVANEEAKAVALGSGDNSGKIEQLGRLMFGEDWEGPKAA